MGAEVKAQDAAVYPCSADPHGLESSVIMTREIEAIYEDGVLRPLEPFPLAQSQRVRVTVTGSSPHQGLLAVDIHAEREERF